MNADKHSPPNIKLYLAVFGSLMILTIITVLVSYWHLQPLAAITIGLAIATLKAGLVAAFFMHLKNERVLIYGLLGLTAFFMVILFTLPTSDFVLLSDRTTHTPISTQTQEPDHP